MYNVQFCTYTSHLRMHMPSILIPMAREHNLYDLDIGSKSSSHGDDGSLCIMQLDVRTQMKILLDCLARLQVF